MDDCGGSALLPEESGKDNLRSGRPGNQRGYWRPFRFWAITTSDLNAAQFGLEVLKQALKQDLVVTQEIRSYHAPAI
jgi:hypothetical protein